MRHAALTLALVALSACNAESPPRDTATSAVPAAPAVTPLPSATPAVDNPPQTGPAAAAHDNAGRGTTPAFVDKHWKVADPAGGQVGTIYTFASDGTLTVDAPGGTPATGRWSYADGKLTMVEEGIAYPTDIVSLDDTHFVIRSHNPGGTVEIAMVAAPAH